MVMPLEVSVEMGALMLLVSSSAGICLASDVVLQAPGAHVATKASDVCQCSCHMGYGVGV